MTSISRRQILFSGLGLTATAALAACSAGRAGAVTTTITVPQTVDSGLPTEQAPARTASTTTATTPATSSSAVSATAGRMTMIPAAGATRVAPAAPITVTVFNAEIDDVTLTGTDGTTISGTVAEDKHTWTANGRPKYGVEYTLTGTATAADGSPLPLTGTFTTVEPKETVRAAVQIPNGRTVGIAAPIVVTFAGQVANRAAAERNLHVSAIDVNDQPIEIEGSWGWMQDEDIQGNGTKQSRVHFRPKDYWPAGTKVHLEAKLYGVDYGDGWGRENVTRDFTIGPALKVVAKVSSHRLLVVEGDKVIENFPVAYGVPAAVDDGRTTVSGIHVITEKLDLKIMCNPKYGYCGFKAYWAVRMNNNGEFIHANQDVADKGLLGKENVSHGCVNMSLKDAKTFYDMVYYGVPVDVEDTGVPMTQADYIWDWSVPYTQWKTFSAL
jgi:lipoprotein-anchoring transpeptidase ErfK/SrfK